MVLNLQDMGYNATLPKGRRRSLRLFGSCVGRSNCRTNLSHTFALPDTDYQMELLNINIATEEALMTLPGVNREIARNIVDHRKAIGRYRKVEDLAVVRGVGAEKFELIRPEVCVSTRINRSWFPSRAPSKDSLKSTDSKSTNRSNRLINVNKASAFELQSIPGVTQEIAAGICMRRSKKGEFKKIDDLLKVKHINRMRLGNIARYLTIDVEENDNCEPVTLRPSVLANGFTPLQPSYFHIERPSVKSIVPNGLAPSSAIDIFELLSTYSPRPILNEHFKFCCNGEPAVRICSWNLHEFSREKANNLGVREVVCRTILETGVSLLAIQDVREVAALKIICEELNKPMLRRVAEWKENSGSWNFCMLEVPDTKVGFIYDSAGVASVELLSLYEGPEDVRSDCDAAIANFLIGDLNLQVINMSLKKDVNFEFLHEKITDLVGEEEMVMLCIDFSGSTNLDETSLNLGGLKAIFQPTTNTTFPILKPGNRSSHISNILTNSTLKQCLTGQKNVITNGITHLAIPNGWSWGGPASPFCPVWVEVFLNHKSKSSTL